jgi:tetratricopeptide (TPR) repeat protein
MPAVTSQQLVTAAGGRVGLLALLDDKGGASIYNPAAYTSLSDHIALLGKEAVSAWQRFLLAFHDDECVPNAHFALGLLYAQREQVINAVAEYKLVANRFSQASLAPYALLCSSKLKTDLHDYLGARGDLRQLVEQYPDTGFSGQACLYLADATMRAGLYDEAERLYRKVYNLGFSAESRTAAALGAGKCCDKTGNHEAAAKWLTRYIGLAGDSASEELYSACFMLGKVNLALGKLKQACDAFTSALAGQLTKEQQMAAGSGLVQAYVQQEDLVEALAVLENARSWQLSEEEGAQMLLLEADVLRSMGLVDKAIAMLGDRAEYWPETQLRARLSFELAKCYIAKGDLQLARRNLSEILVLAEPGSLSNEVALELADVSLKLGQDSQTVAICRHVLNTELSAPAKQRALALLAQAYRRQGDYDKAARALSGQWDQTEAPNEKEMFASETALGL